MPKHYDVIIIGAGPAGIFTALELVDKDRDLEILILEKGRDIDARLCPSKEKKIQCRNCDPCSIVNGWGGAGAFSDGKLTLTTEFGGWLDEYIPKEKVAELINYVDKVFLSFGATEMVHGTDQKKVKQLQRKAATADLRLIPAKVKHLGTEKCWNILREMRNYLGGKVDIKTCAPVKTIKVDDDKVKGVVTESGEEYTADYVVAVPGREGAEWFALEAQRLGLDMMINPVDIGVRVEVPAVVMEPLTDVVYESKLVYYSKSFDDRVRTFCMNPYGEVVIENNSGLITVNGHSYADRKTENTNFALLVSKTFTQPFREPISYGKYIATLANMLGGGVLVQRLGDLLSGRRSTPERIKRGLVVPTLKEATPGDLSLVFPYRHMVSILEMLQAMDKLAPGVYSQHTLLYGVEVKFYSARPALNSSLETQIRNLFAAGDGAGVTRGLAQASVSGVIVAREILNRKLNGTGI
ncbi:NAD(P)/FAD-dependent oxidoreductase [Thermosediminibacter oceani]|uniref:HI0933 family protein n=1 Tax=Thermosediminibacter oceani (strain ATCC BAA-1034 / DSM 16646 / JW/IW-1228P) TaxID=555079 RepID=D9S179_THEOJ|nr:NAD(P)/FAD-dependent oxidoreductase [Thermosediminibacter oceani]ADL08958.1 HI0933 family protein [Thermosediminibacter oceani DSM 16646]